MACTSVARSAGTRALLLLLCFVGTVSGSLGVLGRVENEEGEIRHTVGVLGRADAMYKKGENVRTQAKDVEKSALQMEMVLEKRLSNLMAEESKKSAWIEPKAGTFPTMKDQSVGGVAAKSQQKLTSERPTSAAAARKAAVLQSKKAVQMAKQSQALHASKNAPKTVRNLAVGGSNWIKQWMWPF
mmetsp:Transcript_14573/g.29139  ORF Transcript_14573/g.29139 Transcript_14573/m.29139 type:complete len:185 (+) Transcript_14573:31-585(+)|eukprot:CAMPEP_0181291454 /NCGR_PEP_ID=MMETSP1101-20121128/1974_1 /TAXON_ID=46948 /ORGANISM="Rhodomonas abbreviata, Strain Caron Lab Isolate" /LENGTH=184 /DNA_ID=CAMNT_0023395843 /DNA_START=31 /DNA_END=585 /DNA_ORIENTATION=-